MSGSEEDFKKWYRIIFLIAIVVTCVFCIIFSMLGLRVNSGFTCGIDKQGPNPDIVVYDNHTHTLDHTTDYELQEFSLNASEYLKYEFCFTIYCIGSGGGKIEIINQDGTILNTAYAIQGQSSYCASIQNLSNSQYIGLRCPTCENSSIACIPQEAVAGDTVTHVEADNSTITVSEDSIMTYRLSSYKNCKSLIKFFLWCYIWLLIALFFIMLILVGFRRFEKFIFEEVKL